MYKEKSVFEETIIKKAIGIEKISANHVNHNNLRSVFFEPQRHKGPKDAQREISVQRTIIKNIGNQKNQCKP